MQKRDELLRVSAKKCSSVTMEEKKKPAFWKPALIGITQGLNESVLSKFYKFLGYRIYPTAQAQHVDPLFQSGQIKFFRVHGCNQGIFLLNRPVH